MSASLVYSRVFCRVDARRRRAALEEFSLDCAPGEITCLLGPNGAGKSTALAGAAGLIEAERGMIEFDGKRVASRMPPRGLGYLPQWSAFPSVLTVREVIDFAFSARETSNASREEIVALSGLGGVMEEAVGRLSSGWVRRLGLAVALVPPCRLLLLDEPFVGLDLDMVDALLEHLARRTSEGATVVLSTHDFEIVDRLAPRVAVLKEGRLQGVERMGDKREGARSLYRGMLSGGPGFPVAIERERSYA
jgi:ABC-2 type transport system ATP-binding protein